MKTTKYRMQTGAYSMIVPTLQEARRVGNRQGVPFTIIKIVTIQTIVPQKKKGTK